MEVTENEDEIIIRHKPVRQWIYAGFFLPLVFCCYILFTYYHFFVFSRYLFERNWSNVVWSASTFFAISFLILIFPKISAPLTIITISRKTKSVDILRRRFYGTRTERFYFTQISKFRSHKSKTSPTYFLALVLANKKTNKLNIPMGEKKENSKFIRRINEFIKSAN